MKWKALFAAVVVCIWVATDVLACGNKFLVPSRGTRFGKVPVAREDTRILIYAPPDSAVDTALGEVPVATLLSEVGYRPTTVDNPDELEAALQQGDWALVLADTSSLPSRLEQSDVPAILPVLSKPDRAQLAEARQTYGQVVKAPTKGQRLVETVDFAVAENTSRQVTGSERSTAR